VDAVGDAMEAGHPAQQQIGRVTLVADGLYLAAALSFIREAAGRLGLAAPDAAALAAAVEEVSLNVIARDLCAPIEALGFFFAGIIPELAEDDVLRLQYLNDVEADVDSAKLASEFGLELFAYVVGAMRARAGGV
jgi:hypothetical protein